MCILFIAYKKHKEYPLILLANRDEFRERPTQKAHFWEEYEDLLAGRDLKEGGTWLGLTKNGRLSALTNVRNIPEHKEGRISRGMLVRDYLINNSNPKNYLQNLNKDPMRFNPYNLMVGNVEELYVYSNLNRNIETLETGFHGLSNAHLNSPWPKIGKGIENLKKYIQSNTIHKEELFQIMKNTEQAPDHLLPDTGVGLENERYLSSIFIDGPIYGTRSTAILLVNHQNHFQFSERTFGVGGITEETVDFSF